MIEATPRLDGQSDHLQDLARLGTFLEKGDIEGARAWVGELAKKWPDSDKVRHFVRVLAPPKPLGTRPGTGRPLQMEREWLRNHGPEYPGCWLALDGDRRIAADRDLEVVLDAVEQDERVTEPLLHLQPDPAR